MTKGTIEWHVTYNDLSTRVVYVPRQYENTFQPDLPSLRIPGKLIVSVIAKPVVTPVLPAYMADPACGKHGSIAESN